MTQHDDDFDQDAFEAAFAKEFGRTLPTEPDPQPEPKTVIAMVLTPVAEAEVLARLMGLVKITWPVFASRTGAVAATTLRIDPLAQLTGHTPPEAVKIGRHTS